MSLPDIRIPFDIDGRQVLIRTITPADRDLEASFVRSLSDRSRYYRFHSALRELTEDLLIRFINVDYPATMALIATVIENGAEQQIGVARYATTPPGSRAAEVAVVVADAWQGRGIGSRLLVEIRNVALAAGIEHLHMHVLAENQRMLALAQHLGFEREAPAGGYSRTLGKTISRPD